MPLKTQRQEEAQRIILQNLALGALVAKEEGYVKLSIEFFLSVYITWCVFVAAGFESLLIAAITISFEAMQAAITDREGF